MGPRGGAQGGVDAGLVSALLSEPAPPRNGETRNGPLGDLLDRSNRYRGLGDGRPPAIAHHNRSSRLKMADLMSKLSNRKQIAIINRKNHITCFDTSTISGSICRHCRDRDAIVPNIRITFKECADGCLGGGFWIWRCTDGFGRIGGGANSGWSRERQIRWCWAGQAHWLYPENHKQRRPCLRHVIGIKRIRPGLTLLRA